VEEGRHRFIIVDAPAIKVWRLGAWGASLLVLVKLQQCFAECTTFQSAPSLRLQVADFKDFWAAGQASGYDVMVAEPPETDPQVRPGFNAAG
jgi:hypothetical protein